MTSTEMMVDVPDLRSWGMDIKYLDAPIHFTEAAKELVPHQCQFWPFLYEGIEGFDGALGVLPPRSKTGVALLREETRVDIDILKGSGICVALEQSRTPPYFREKGHDYIVRIIQLSPGNHVYFTDNQVYGLKTGQEGMVVKLDTKPRYQWGVTEIVLPDQNQRAKKNFWEYWNLPYEQLCEQIEYPEHRA